MAKNHLYDTDNTDTRTTQTIKLTPPRSRRAYVSLGIIFGIFGTHNFYAGFTVRALAQLILSLLFVVLGSQLNFWFLLPIGAIWVWALIEVCIVDHDVNHCALAW